MIPGVSRSGATIMGALTLGVDRKTAAELASSWPPHDARRDDAAFSSTDDAITAATIWAWIALAALVSFVVAWVVILRSFLAVVTRYGFAPFAWYWKLIVGAAALVWLAMR